MAGRSIPLLAPLWDQLGLAHHGVVARWRHAISPGCSGHNQHLRIVSWKGMILPAATFLAWVDYSEHASRRRHAGGGAGLGEARDWRHDRGVAGLRLGAAAVTGDGGGARLGATRPSQPAYNALRHPSRISRY